MTVELVSDNYTPDTATFAEFWSWYPRKVGKFYAEQCFNKLVPHDRVTAIQSLPRYLEYWSETVDHPKYLPHASTFLNRRMWLDDLICALPVKKPCAWPKCTHTGTHAYGTGASLYCEQHIAIFQRGGTPPR